MNLLTILLAGLLSTLWSTVAQASDLLPSEFSILAGSSRSELVWEPTTDAKPAVVVRVGALRYEFRLADGTILGYPRESQLTPDGPMVLVLALTPAQEHQLDNGGGQGLQVWYSERRLDAGRPPNSGGASSGVAPPAVASVTPTPTVPIDPAAPGPYITDRLSYNLSPRVAYKEFKVPMEVVAEVTYPIKDASSPKSPLVLFLHGRHATCYKGGPSGTDALEWPCKNGRTPIPSHRGYRYVADLLASRGYVTVSISANSINAQDNGALDYGAAARSILIHHHLSLWAKWNKEGGDPWSGFFKGTLDLSKVVLVGHSRGGEGVNRAAIDATPSDPYKIVGLVSYGPTSFGRQVTPDVHSATILPTCDGDVSDLQGQKYIDDSRDIAQSPALRSAVIALGCNHNFFNTEWTPGLAKAPSVDDWDAYVDPNDPVCGSSVGVYRLTAEEQQVVGAAYTAALVRLAVKREVKMLQFLDGSYVRPASIGRAEVATHTVGGSGYRLLYRPESAGVPTLLSGMKGGECSGFGSSLCYNDFYNAPHWLPRIFEESHPPPRALRLQWTESRATARFAVSSRQRDLSTMDYVDIRVANDPKGEEGAQFEMYIQDTTGRYVALNTSLATIEGWPGSGILDRVHARALRGSLASVPAGSIDLTDTEAVFLVANSPSGKVYVLDVAASQAQIAQPVPLNLPVLSLDQIKVSEGDGPQTVKVEITSDRPITTKGAVWFDQYLAGGRKVNLAPGSTTTVAEVPVSWIGDDYYYGSNQILYLTIGAVEGALTGNYVGTVTLVEDEPKPSG